MSTAATSFSTPQARRKRGRSRRNRRTYCIHDTNRTDQSNNNGIGSDGSYLSLDTREIVIDADPQSESRGGADGSEQVVTLTWNIAEDVNPLDWIGLYSAGEKNPFRYLDYRSHGLRCQTSGQLQWKLNSELFARRNHARVRFKYYDGLNGNLRAISPILAITLINQHRRRSNTEMQPSSNENAPLERLLNISIKEMSCEGLRKSIIPPQFYVHLTLNDSASSTNSTSNDQSSQQKPSVTSFKTKPVNSLQPKWTDLNFDYTNLPISSSIFLRFVIKDKNRPRFYRIMAQGMMNTLDLCNYAIQTDQNQNLECGFSVDMHLTKITSIPSPSKSSTINNNNNKMECKLNILARLGMSTKASSTTGGNGGGDSAASTMGGRGGGTQTRGSSPNPRSLITGHHSRRRRSSDMQQQQQPPASAFVSSSTTTPSASSTSFSSASSGASGSTAGGGEAGCSKCGLHRIPRLKHSDSGISQSSGEHQSTLVKSENKKPPEHQKVEAPSTSGALHTSHHFASPSPIHFRRRWTPSSSGSTLTRGELTIRPRSLPHSPIKSPRLRRPDTLNVVCACCLSNGSNPTNLLPTAENSSNTQPPPALTPQLAATTILKNTPPSTASSSCHRCAELRARWAFTSSTTTASSASSNSTKPTAAVCPEGTQENSTTVATANPMMGTENENLAPPGTPTSGSAASSSASSSMKKHAMENYVDMLPPFWEARIDSHARVFYVDHLNKTTTWERPQGPNSCRVKQVEQARRQLMDRRYLCMRKTVGSAVGRVEVPEGDYSKWPAVLFLARPDFMMFLHSNDVAKEMYCNSQSIRHIIHRVRKDPAKFERYQYNKDIVALLNEFSDKSAGMPSNWEAKIDPSGREFFVDHKNKRTTFIDPRLPMPSASNNRRRRTRSAPSETEESDVGLTYNERVVNFMRRPDAMDVMRQRVVSLRTDSKLKRKINAICKAGVPALKKFANDVDLITLLSLCEEDILSEAVSSSTSKTFSTLGQDEFDVKLGEFYERLQQKGYGQGPGKLRVSTRREQLLKDAFEQVMAASRKDLQRNKLNIVFDDEEGLDYGGPSREFFFLLSRELFNPYYGLFEYSANDTYTVQIGAMSIFVDNYIEWFQFCGRILGLALIHRYLLDTFFTRAFYKFLLRSPCSVSDLESLDNQFYTSLLWLHENQVTPDLGLTFSVNEEVGGELMERELIMGGNAIPVTEENKHEYIERMVKWRLERGVKKQGNSVLKGFYEVVDPQLIKIFDARELELVLAGTIEIDIGDWRTNTEYRGGYHDDHIVILWFWQAVERFTNAQRLLLLQFVTGTSSIPYEGFTALRGSHGPKRFTIEKWGSPGGLPRAHTCFNRLDLPPYTSFAALSHKMLTAIEESSSFGIE